MNLNQIKPNWINLNISIPTAVLLQLEHIKMPDIYRHPSSESTCVQTRKQHIRAIAIALANAIHWALGRTVVFPTGICSGTTLTVVIGNVITISLRLYSTGNNKTAASPFYKHSLSLVLCIKRLNSTMIMVRSLAQYMLLVLQNRSQQSECILYGWAVSHWCVGTGHTQATHRCCDCQSIEPYPIDRDVNIFHDSCPSVRPDSNISETWDKWRTAWGWCDIYIMTKRQEDERPPV